MILLHLLAAVVAGVLSAIAALVAGHSLPIALLVYPVGGAAGMILSALASLALPAPRPSPRPSRRDLPFGSAAPVAIGPPHAARRG